jgi:tetratricopeptide (TPR) repeat protein
MGGRRPGGRAQGGNRGLRARASDQGRAASTDPRHTLARLRTDLAELEARAAELDAWEVSTELAGAWAELLDFERAIALYEEALARGSTVRLEAIEELGNLQIREAIRRYRAGRSEGVADYVASAKTWLMRAATIAESGERLALLGSYRKKCATMTSGAERVQHLDEARAFYARANAATETTYYQLNARQLGAIARICAREGGGEVEPVAGPAAESEPAEAAPDQAAKPEKAPDFWLRAARGDRLLTTLVEGVAAHRPDEEIGTERLEASTATRDEMVTHYVAAFRLRSSARERASVIDHLDDLALLLPEDHPLAELLSGSAKELGAWPGPEQPSRA